jgi:5-methylcytosine-specific restriction endonuclease McrA
MLNSPTLVLNRTWVPINITTAKRAVVMAFVDLVRIVDVDTYELHSFDNWVSRGPTNGNVIHGVDNSFDVPEVVVLRKFDRVPRGGVVFSRRNLYRRDNYTCQYCGSRPGTQELTLDHVLPRSMGGRTTWENCVLACTACNTRKGGRTPDGASMLLRTVPRKPAWSPWYSFARRFKKPRSWDAFISDVYWNSVLEE